MVNIRYLYHVRGNNVFGISRQAFLDRQLIQTLTLSVIILPFSSFCHGETLKDETRFFEPLAVYTNEDSASCQGSLGVNFGLGRRTIENQIDQTENHESDRFQNNEGEISQSFVTFNKGLPWPIDVGATIGSFGNGVSQGGAHIKWTLFQQFQYPSVALRASFNQLWGIENSKIYQHSADLLLSYAFSRFMEINGNYRSAQQTLEKTQVLGSNQIISNVKIISGSIKLKIIPPVLSVSLERQLIQNDSSYLIRFTISS